MITQQKNSMENPLAGIIFSRLCATTLAGRKVTFSDDIKGKITFLALVFEDGGAYKEAQSQADGWAKFWEDKLKKRGIDFYEIPMMSGKYKWLRIWVNRGMRSDIPKEKHDNVACFYGDKQKYMQLLGITALRKAHVLLIDENGKILVQQEGEVQETSMKEFITAIDK